MARYEMDRDGVSTVRAAVGGDPAVLREVADVVAAASAAARSVVGSEEAGLAAEIDRFRLVHARLLDAMADAVAALCGELRLAVQGDRETELAAASALGSIVGVLGHAAVVGARR
jgi:hypothetical protein